MRWNPPAVRRRILPSKMPSVAVGAALGVPNAMNPRTPSTAFSLYILAAAPTGRCVARGHSVRWNPPAVRRRILPSKMPSVAVGAALGVPNAMNPRTPSTAFSLYILAAAPTGRCVARGHSVRWNPPAVRRRIPPLKIPSVAAAAAPGVPNAMNPRTPTTAWSLYILAVAPTGRCVARGHLVRWNPPAVRSRIPPSKIPSVAVGAAPGVPNEMHPRTPTAAWSLCILAAAPTGRCLARGHSVRWNLPAERKRIPPQKIPSVAVGAARSWHNSQRGPALRPAVSLHMCHARVVVHCGWKNAHH